MPPLEEIWDLVQQWLRKAEEDLDLASHLLDEEYPYLNAIGFHAQQAAEKFLKAYLTSIEVEFAKSHSIEYLLELMALSHPTVAEQLEGAIALTQYGVAVRYPGDLPDLSPPQAAEAVALARMVAERMKLLLGG